MSGAENVIEKTIRGKVLDEEGKPVAGAEVWLSVYCKQLLGKVQCPVCKIGFPRPVHFGDSTGLG